MTDSALTGLNVLELGESVAVAYCGRWLAAFGADVTKVEPSAGDWTRRYGVAAATDAARDMSALFAYLNTGKRSVTQDFDRDSAEAGASLRQRASLADLIIHPFAPADLERLGLGPEARRDAGIGSLIVSVSDFGSDGPYASYRGAPIVHLALGGYLHLSGAPDRAPLMLPGFQSEYLGGLHAVIAALALSLDRRLNRPTQAEVSLMEVMTSLHQFTTVQFTYEGVNRKRNGNRRENLHPSTLIPCKDGYVGMALPTNDLWARQCAMIGQPELADDPRFATPAPRPRG